MAGDDRFTVENVLTAIKKGTPCTRCSECGTVTPTERFTWNNQGWGDMGLEDLVGVEFALKGALDALLGQAVKDMGGKPKFIAEETKK